MFVFICRFVCRFVFFFLHFGVLSALFLSVATMFKTRMADFCIIHFLFFFSVFGSVSVHILSCNSQAVPRNTFLILFLFGEMNSSGCMSVRRVYPCWKEKMKRTSQTLIMIGSGRHTHRKRRGYANKGYFYGLTVRSQSACLSTNSNNEQ